MIDAGNQASMRWLPLLVPMLVLAASSAPTASAEEGGSGCETPADLCFDDDDCVLNRPGAVLENPVGSVLACVNMTA